MKNLQVRVKTDLSTEPVTSAEAKLFAKIPGTTEDSLVTIFISAARQALEKYTASSFAEKTLHATWIKLPDDNELELPYGPVIAVSKVYKIDEEGTETELTLNTDYHIYGDQDIIVKIESFWSTGIQLDYSIRVEYTAGYGHANTETLPAPLKEAIMKQVATDYEFREDVGPETILCNESKKRAAPYRKHVWF
jgi:uncharacterized phiE125 gp8 family phage protein